MVQAERVDLAENPPVAAQRTRGQISQNRQMCQKCQNIFGKFGWFGTFGTFDPQVDCDGVVLRYQNAGMIVPEKVDDVGAFNSTPLRRIVKKGGTASNSRPFRAGVFVWVVQMAVAIRRAQQSDLDQLLVLWQEQAELHADLAPEFALVPGGAQNMRAHLADLLRDDNERVFVAEENGALIGFINGTVRENPPVFAERFIGYIADAIVTARSRRRGVGEQLVRAINAWFRERGIRIIHLSAAIGNPISQAFWRKMGFVEYMTRMRNELD